MGQTSEGVVPYREKFGYPHPPPPRPPAEPRKAAEGCATCARRSGSEGYARGFTNWGQFMAMLFCQVGRAHSLREICGGLASRSYWLEADTALRLAGCDPWYYAGAQLPRLKLCTNRGEIRRNHVQSQYACFRGSHNLPFMLCTCGASPGCHRRKHRTGSRVPLRILRLCPI
jgi:hypothetical protein